MSRFTPFGWLAIAAVLPSFAQSTENPSRFQWGIHGQVLQSQGDLRDLTNGEKGYGLGLNGSFKLGEKNLLRGRLELNRYRDSDGPGYVVTNTGPLGFSLLPVQVHSEVQNATLGLDYQHNFFGGTSGLYSVLGLEAVRWKVHESFGSYGNRDVTTTKFGRTVGLGWQWNKSISTEFRVNGSDINHAIGGAPSCVAAITWKF